jgi:hypothetical protein
MMGGGQAISKACFWHWNFRNDLSVLCANARHPQIHWLTQLPRSCNVSFLGYCRLNVGAEQIGMTMDKKLGKPSNKCPKFWHKSLLCFARILSIGVVSSFAFGNGEPSAGIQAEPKLEARRAFLPLDPKSALAFLKASGTVLGSPQIFVSRFNVDEGLLVGYQSETGKRILFRSRTFPGIGTSGQVLHFDS